MSMDSESGLDLLTSSGILEKAGIDDHFQFTREFQTDLKDQQRKFEEDHGRSEADIEIGLEQTQFGDLYRERPDLIREYPDFWALCTVLETHLPSKSEAELVKVACVLDQVRRGFPPSEGSPKGFLSIYGDRLPILLPFQTRAVVFIWRKECPPCETMRERLEELTPRQEGSMARISVYGPAEAELLYSEYSVEGGPTTLFIVDGSVDARLIGPHYRNVIDNEIAKLFELT